MFKRSKPRPFLEKIRNYIYPKMGLFRTLKYHIFRIIRLPDDGSTIAKGLAIGLAISFTPFIGFHLGIISVLCLLFKGNIVAAFMSSLLGNPFTFPLIWYCIYNAGLFILPSFKAHSEPFLNVFINLAKSVYTFDWNLFIDKVYNMLIPMIIGCIPFVIIIYILTYKLSYFYIKKYQEIREKFCNTKEGCK